MTAAAWSPDGLLLVSSGWDLAVRVWGADGRPIRVLASPDTAVSTLRFSGDGRFVVGVSTGRGIFVWATDTGVLVKHFVEKDGQHMNAAMSEDNSRVAAVVDDQLIEWERASGRLVIRRPVPLGSVVTGGVDHQFWVAGPILGIWRCWPASDPKMAFLLEPHEAKAWGFGRSVTWAHDNQRLCVYAKEEGFESRCPRPPVAVAGLDVGAAWVDGQDLYVDVRGAIRKVAAPGATHIAASPDGARVAVLDGSHAVRLLGPEGLEGGVGFAAHAVEADGPHAWSVAGTDLWRLDLGSDHAQRCLPGEVVRGVRAQGGRLWVAHDHPSGDHGVISELDPRNLLRAPIAVGRYPRGADRVEIAAQGNAWISVGAEGLTWGTPKGVRGVQAPRRSAPEAWAMDDCGAQLAVAWLGGEVAWGKPGAPLPVRHRAEAAVWALAFAPCAARIAVADVSGEIVVADAETAEVVWRVRSGSPTLMRWSPDGQHLVVGHHDGTVEVWALGAQRPAHRFGARDGEVVALDVLGDGKIVAAFRDTSVALLWAPRLMVPLAA